MMIRYGTMQLNHRNVLLPDMTTGFYGLHGPTERAYGLLLRHLTPQQCDTLKWHNWFDVVSSSGKRYRIFAQRGRNVSLMRGAEKAACYDAHIKGDENIPIYDNLLAQKLALESNDRSFCFSACGHRIVNGERRDTWGWPFIKFLLCFIPLMAFFVFSLITCIAKLIELLVGRL